MTTSGQAPLERSVEANVPAVAAAADDSTVFGDAPFAGAVIGVAYAPEAAVTGDTVESRTLSLVNHGQAGAGTTVVASLVLATGVDLVAYDAKALTLSAVADATTVAAGDELEWRSVHAGTTGLADPGGRVEVTFARA